MNKTIFKKSNLVILFVCLFLTIIFAFDVAAEEPQFFPNIKYDSTVAMEYDTSTLEQPIAIDKGITIPIVLTYSTELTKESYSIIPENLLYRFYFGSTQVPQQTIQLKTMDISNIDISLDREEISFDIPFDDSSFQTTVNLTITPSNKASAMSYMTKINATCNKLYRLNGSSVEKYIQITPAYMPCATISENKLMMLNSSSINSTTVSIKNCGNSNIRVTPKLITTYENISVIICPKYIDLSRDEKDSFNISTYARSSFEEVIPLDFNFTIEKYPIGSNNEIIYKNFTIECEYKETDEDNFFLNPLFIIIVLLVISNIIVIGKYKRFW